MYYAELLALNFYEIEHMLNKHGIGKIFQIFFLESNFAEYIDTCFLNSKIEKILPEIYQRLITIQELIYYEKLLHSDPIPTPTQLLN
jgi:hypothetical protein